MSRQALALSVTVLGVLVLLLSSFADALGLGQYPGFGWRQILGLILGVIAIWLGFRWRRRARNKG